MTGNTTEPTLNTHLAHLLRRMGLEAESEQRVRDAAGKHHQIDVLIELDDDDIALEASSSVALPRGMQSVGRCADTLRLSTTDCVAHLTPT